MDHRNRTAPIALPRDTPVTQPVIDFRFALIAGCQLLDDLLDGARHVEAVEKIRIDQPAVIDKSLAADFERCGVLIGRADHREDRQLIFARELKIALIMGRAAENRPGAIFHQHEIGDIDRQLEIGDEGMAHAQSGVDADFICFFNGFFASSQSVAFLCECRDRGIVAGQLGAQGMVGRQRAK